MTRGVGLLVACFGFAGCSSIHLPEGDPAAGRSTFLHMGCAQCHRVDGEDFPEPGVQPPVPVILGSRMDRKSRAYLAESIVDPAYRLAKRRPIVAGDPPIVPPRAYENITVGGRSRMRDYTHQMTLKQWTDLVAYLEAAQERPQGMPAI